MIAADDQRAVALTATIRAGDIAGLVALLDRHPEVAVERIGDGRESRAALHVATDWPGHWPGVAATIERLVAAGANSNARFAGAHSETPLHWAASSDDVAALDALVAAGADLEADGGVLTGGPPLDDAVVFAQYAAARRLVEHGAAVACWHAAALGLGERVDRHLADGVADTEITAAAWHAAGAGHADVVRALIEAGADLQAVVFDDLTILGVADEHGHDHVAALLRAHDAR